MVFNMAYGIQGESRYTHIPSMLEMLGLPYVGSSPSGHALALDKVLTKIIWKNNGLPTPEFWVFSSPDEDLSNVKYPVIIKPKMESVSFGLKVVYHEDELRDAVKFVIEEFNQPALVEQFIQGREFAVGLLGNTPVEVFPVLEFDLGGDPNAIQTVDNKKYNPKSKVCPAEISEELAQKMKDLSLLAFKALNLRDFSRVDIRLDKDNNIYLLEINSMASLGESGSYLTSAKAVGYNFDSLVNKMLDVASLRYFSDTILMQDIDDKSKGKLSTSVRLRAFIKSRQNQTEKTLKKLIDSNTHVRNVESVNYCSKVIINEFKQLGFTYETYPQFEVGNITFLSNTTSEELDYLILLPIDNKVKLERHENFEIHDQYLQGTGVWENKGGVAVLLSAVQALRYSRNLKKTKIGILVTTDSTLEGKYSKNIITSIAKRAKQVIAVSGCRRTGGIILSRSGSAVYRFDIKMIEKENAESVTITALNFNKILASITSLSKDDEEFVIAPYEIQFKSNIYKRYAYGTAGISVRYNTEVKLKEIESKIRQVVSKYKSAKIYKLQLEGGQHRPPMERSSQSELLYEKIAGITKKIDVRASMDHRWSSADICHISSEQPKVDGLGPIGEFLPDSNERILRHSLLERSLLLSLLLKKD